MRYRAITLGLVKDNKGTLKPLQSFSDSMEVINAWAHETSKNHNVDVRIFQAYERILTTVRKPHEEPENVRELGCFCGERVYCPIHPGQGWLKGRKA